MQQVQKTDKSIISHCCSDFGNNESQNGPQRRMYFHCLKEKISKEEFYQAWICKKIPYHRLVCVYNTEQFTFEYNHGGTACNECN